MKARHAQGGLLPASIHMFQRCKKVTLRVPSQPSAHVYEKASSHREGYCWGNSQTSYHCAIRLPTAHSLSVNIIFSLSYPYFLYFLASHAILPKVQYCPSLKYVLYFSNDSISARQFTPIAPRFSNLGIAEIGKASTYGNHFIFSTDLMKINPVVTSFLFVAWKLTPEIHLSPCRSLSIMPNLKRNEFIDDAIGGLLLIGCGWLLDCLSSRGIHVLASSKFLWTSDDSNTSDVGGKFLLRSCMWWCLTDILPVLEFI